MDDEDQQPNPVLFVGGAWDGRWLYVPKLLPEYRIAVTATSLLHPWGEPPENSKPTIDHQTYRLIRHVAGYRLYLWEPLTEEELLPVLIRGYRQSKETT